MRINLDELREGKLSANLLLQDSDMIIVPPAERFYVSGFVKTPGSFVLRSGMTVAPGDRRSGRHQRARLDARHQDHPQGPKRPRNRDRREDVGSRSPERHHPRPPAPDLSRSPSAARSAADSFPLHTHHRARPCGRALLARSVALSRAAVVSRVARHRRALQADRDRRRVGVDPAGADAAGVRRVPPDGRPAAERRARRRCWCSRRSCRGSSFRRRSRKRRPA